MTNDKKNYQEKTTGTSKNKVKSNRIRKSPKEHSNIQVDNKSREKLSREIALDVIMEITDKGNFSHKVLSRTLDKHYYLEKKDRAFISILCEGVIERLLTLDYIINCYSKIKVNKMKPLIRTLLRLSVYQLYFMDGVPASAVCDEAVKIAKLRGFSGLSGFVNGVLRNMVRNPEIGQIPHDISIRYSVPNWLAEELIVQYGESIVNTIFKSSFEKQETTVRCNEDKVSPEDLRKELEEEGVHVEQGSFLPYAFKLTGYDSLGRLQSFQKGHFTVQDESSMLVGEIAGVKPGDAIIDVCAAPGGKSLHVASKLKGSGHVSSRDVSEHKIALIKENMLRLGLTNLTVKVQDALTPCEDSKLTADILIADLPCSGLGVIGKKPDIKYNMTKDKLDELKTLQQEILTVVSDYVKPGGVLIYSTCTINQGENLDNLNWFLKKFPFKLEPLDEFLPSHLTSETTKKGYLQLIQGVHPSDGFFIARLKKCE